MGLEEFRYWEALYAREPWGEVAEDRRAAVIASSIWGSHGVETKVSNFLPDDPWKEKPAAMTDDQIREAFMRCDAML